MSLFIMLEWKIGHLVSPTDEINGMTLNLHPKEANDVHSEYSTLFPLPTNPYSPPEGLRRCQECLPGSIAQQAVLSPFLYLWEANLGDPQSRETVGTRPGFWSCPELAPLPVAEGHLSSLPEDSHRRVRAFRPLSAGD